MTLKPLKTEGNREQNSGFDFLISHLPLPCPSFHAFFGGVTMIRAALRKPQEASWTQPSAAKAAVLRGDYGATISRTLPVLADCLIRLFRTIPVLADGLVLAVFEGSCTWLNSFLRTLLHRIQYAGSLLE
jgi:hypothetical protein